MDQELVEMVELYEAGLTQRQVAARLGRNVSTIQRRFKRLGLDTRRYRDYYAAEVDESYFKSIDTEVKAYWLGFVLADACISKSCGDFRAFHFNLQRRDRNMIVAFKESISYTGKVRDFVHVKNDKRYLKSGIDFNNKGFCDILIDLGWFNFKSDDPTILNEIPCGLSHHFVRGFFDGDGCISYNRKRFKSHYFSFSGSRNVLKAIGTIISAELSFKEKEPKKSKRYEVYRIGWNGNKQVAKFGCWLYRESTVYMPRKYDRFSNLWAGGIIIPKYSLDSHNNFRFPLSRGEILKLTDFQRRKLAIDFVDKIKDRPWVYPRYTDSQLRLDWGRVKDECVSNYRVADGYKSNKSANKEFAGRKILVHFQPHYWDTRYRHHMTLVEGWGDDKVRLKAARNMFCTNGGRPSLARYLRELNFSGARRVSHFHPGLAKAILSDMAPDARSYLDPCAGWGARLLAAASLSLDYTACDPNHLTINGLEEMSRYFGFKPTLLNVPFEDFEVRDRYDVVFTSPPYFNIERYEHGRQSYLDKSGYSDWFENFLMPLICKCCSCSEIVLLHVSDKIMESLSGFSVKVIPTTLQRTAGRKRSAEYFVQVRL